jgi:hypothetical protein
MVQYGGLHAPVNLLQISFGIVVTVITIFYNATQYALYVNALFLRYEQ